MPEFCNPYHFVPVEEAKPNEDDSTNREHWLNINDFNERRNLNHYSHASYHPNTYSGRIICRLKTEDAMFIGALRQQPDPNDAATVTPFELEEGQPATSFAYS